VGKLRWRPPQPHRKWYVRPANAFGPHCIQFGAYPDMIFHDPGASEDCLTLNVWTPSGAKPGSLPVMVWIYGGGFTAGGTSEARQDGEYLARRNVVVVSMNYRLGMLGFLALRSLAEESPHHAAGDYGLLDQAAALAWVKRNISAFGGDPNNITLFGESAGSFSVSAQMASPISKDLLAQAIGESGAAFFSSGLPWGPLKSREISDAALVKKVLGTDDLAALRKIPAATLANTAAFRSVGAFPPDIDGYFLPASLPSLYAAGEEAHIPLLAGWNADEVRGMVLFAPVATTAASFTNTARQQFGANADKFLSLYPAGSDAQAVQSAGDFASDRFIAYSTWRWLEAHVATGEAPTYRYHFDLPSPTDQFHHPGSGAFHSDDIEYVFGTLDSRRGAHWRPEDRALSDLMQQYWTNFARNGNPNAPDLPDWPTYQASTDWQVMHLNSDSEAQPDAQRQRYLFLDSLWGKSPSGSDAAVQPSRAR
jgi:para-nitrobenzyl esterase